MSDLVDPAECAVHEAISLLAGAGMLAQASGRVDVVAHLEKAVDHAGSALTLLQVAQS